MSRREIAGYIIGGLAIANALNISAAIAAAMAAIFGEPSLNFQPMRIVISLSISIPLEILFVISCKRLLFNRKNYGRPN